jgi:serine/threonine protein kinase
LHFQIISRIRTAEFTFDDPVWESVSDIAKSLITGLLTVDPKKRIKMGQLITHPWLKSNANNSQELQTPTVLPENCCETFNQTINAFLSANRDGFHLMEVDSAPLLVKRRGMKRRSSGSTTKKRSITSSSGSNSSLNNKVPAKLMAVHEENESTPNSRRPTTLDIEMDSGICSQPGSAAFTNIRDTKPADLKYSRDIDNTTSST